MSEDEEEILFLGFSASLPLQLPLAPASAHAGTCAPTRGHPGDSDKLPWRGQNPGRQGQGQGREGIGSRS
jgi:hypothetical protein